eukprot:scaffold1525_cov142-Cylindrotheca_fusiformis.AAC.81
MYIFLEVATSTSSSRRNIAVPQADYTWEGETNKRSVVMRIEKELKAGMRSEMIKSHTIIVVGQKCETPKNLARMLEREARLPSCHVQGNVMRHLWALGHVVAYKAARGAGLEKTDTHGSCVLHPFMSFRQKIPSEGVQLQSGRQQQQCHGPQWVIRSNIQRTMQYHQYMCSTSLILLVRKN